MSGHDNTKIGKFPTLEMLVAELERIDAEHHRLHADDVDDATIEPVYERHWALRALINATPARCPSGLRAKDRAAQIATALDPDFACHVPGSARELTKSLADDALAIMGCAQPS